MTCVCVYPSQLPGPLYEGLDTHKPQSSSFLRLPYRILNMNPQKELLWGLWVVSISEIVLAALMGPGLQFMFGFETLVSRARSLELEGLRV